MSLCGSVRRFGLRTCVLAFQHEQLSRRPFVSDFGLDQVAGIAQELGHRFGAFQNAECTYLVTYISGVHTHFIKAETQMTSSPGNT